MRGGETLSAYRTQTSNLEVTIKKLLERLIQFCYGFHLLTHTYLLCSHRLFSFFSGSLQEENKC